MQKKKRKTNKLAEWKKYSWTYKKKPTVRSGEKRKINTINKGHVVENRLK